MSDRFEALADRLAERVVDEVRQLLNERDAQPLPLLDAAGAAKFLGVDRAAIYAMAKDGRLPVVKLGGSERARLRFDRQALLEHLAPEEPQRRRSNGHRRRPSPHEVDLLPIRGDSR
jgi:excisionase family DNA binding protein